ncbi:MAG: hypothetical protein IKJ61_00605 [Bacteroidaceae bacterium]|nr:hypothetical protein [Bacteroidaceae bacterium]
MESIRFKVAGHIFEIAQGGMDITGLLPNLKPFTTDDNADALFTMRIDNSINPSWRGTRIGFFPCPSASFEVYRMDNGAYQILILMDGKIPCTFIESDSEYRNFTVASRGSEANIIFGLNNALMVIFTMCSAAHSTLLMHSSVVENEGKGYMFLGVSGQGKSTHSDLWVKHIPGSTLINDDNPVVRIADDGTPIVYGSPWSGKRPIYKNVHYPIGGFASIEQEKDNRIRKESIPVAFGIMLNSCSTLKFDKQIHLAVCQTVSKILEQIPVHTLQCRPDKEAAEVSSNVLKV